MPSTPSSMTLSSGISDVRPSSLRRTMSTLSSESDEPLVLSTHRARRSETYTGSALCPPSIKRAPSFGSSRNSLESVAMSIDFNAKNSDATSSDEEDKLRNQNAKRARRKASSPTLAPPSESPAPASSHKRARIAPKTPSKVPISSGQGGNQSQNRASKPRANLQRNPSIIGPELPNPQRTPQSPVASRTRSGGSAASRRPDSPVVYSAVPASPYTLASIPPVTPSPHRSSRRNRPTAPLPRTSLARKISFGSLMSGVEETSGGSGAGLGSAFQLN